ncbi:MAG TPA: hypothetical protein VFB96_16615 [Pirellulaceae bacterium]|jgi:hypothetical protein|nr:hypothetical protein [Pirellulaceae bacterium]
MRLITRLATFTTLLIVAGSASLSRAQFDDLVDKVPQSANAIFLLNVDKVLASPAASKNNWKEKVQEAYTSGVTILPPQASQAVLSASLDLESTHTLWESAVMRLKNEPSLDTVARISRGSVEDLDGMQTVALPGDAYLVQFTSKVVGAMAPANRQAISRWIREIKGRKGNGLSPYLAEAFSFANELGTPIVLALDLEHATSADQIRLVLASEPKFEEETGVAIEKAATFLTSIRGVTLGITLADKPFGKIKVDFEQDVPFTPDVAKSLLLKALARRGATIDEIEGWTAKVNGKQITVEGYLEKSGTRRIFSLFDRPPSLPSKGESMPTQELSKEELVKAATKTYFTNMEDMLDDLRDKPKTASHYTVGQKAVWYKTYARKIERLPVLNVDPDLMQFSSQVSSSLYQAADAITSGAARSRTRQVNAAPTYNYYTNSTVYGYSYRSDDYGSGYMPYGSTNTVAVEDVQAEFNNRARIRTEERVASMNQARGIVEQMEQAVSSMRKQLTQKYQIEF